MTYDPVSLESLLAHQGWARRMARRLVREEGEAEDLVQRTWLAAMRRPPDRESGARAWIRKVILNLARERHRRDQARMRHEVTWALGERVAVDASESAAKTELCRLLAEQLQALSEPYRSVLVQRYYDGLTSAEISRRLGVPAGTVRWRLKVGLDQLRAELDRRSNGDRSKWVSALLLLVPDGPGTPADDDLEDAPAPAGAVGPGFVATAGWLGLAVAVAVGVHSLATSATGRREGEVAVAPAERAADQPRVPAGGSAESTAVLRTPVASGPVSTAAAGPAPAGGLSIEVVDGAGQSVSAARLVVGKATGFEDRGETDADGRARLAVAAGDVGALEIPATEGRVAVRALAPGLVASELLHVAAPFTGEHAVRLVVGGPELVLRGRVVDERGEPVPDAVLAWLDPLAKLRDVVAGDFASPSYLATSADERGEFTLANVAGSSGRLLGLAPGRAAAYWDQRRTSEGNIEVRLVRGATVSGRLRLPDGRPAADASIACEPMFRSSEWMVGLPGHDAYRRGFSERARTDADGRFRLEGVTPGPRTLWALDADGRFASAALELENGIETTWDAELHERAPLRLCFVDEAGRPLSGWQAHVRQRVLNYAWWIRRCTADEEGRVVVADCPDGEVVVDLFQPHGVGASYVSRRVSRGDAEHRIEAETRQASAVSGQVLDAQGAPELDGRLVFHSVRATMNVEVGRSADGEFEQRLAPGLYLVQLRIDEAAVSLAEFRLMAGENRALGVLTAPPLGTLRIDASRLHQGGGHFYELLALYDENDEKRFFRVQNGQLEGEVVLPAFAGRYALVTHDPSTADVRRHALRVAPGAETVIEILP